jgi:hypothetical protein
VSVEPADLGRQQLTDRRLVLEREHALREDADRRRQALADDEVEPSAWNTHMIGIRRRPSR